jgi:hypothetical protein
MMAERLLLWGIVAHLICDWLLQNEWMALNKISLRHPAAYVHSGIHLCGLLLVFPWPWALGLAVSHLLIDTRKPLIWWRTLIRQTTDPTNPASIHVAFWGDQVAHISCLALAAGLLGKG